MTTSNVNKIKSLAEVNNLVELLQRMYPNKEAINANWDFKRGVEKGPNADALAFFLATDVADQAESRRSASNLQIAMDTASMLNTAIRDLQITMAGMQEYIVTVALYDFFSWVKLKSRVTVDASLLDAWLAVEGTEILTKYVPEIVKQAGRLSPRFLRGNAADAHPPMSLEEIEKILALLAAGINMTPIEEHLQATVEPLPTLAPALAAEVQVTAAPPEPEVAELPPLEED